MVVKYFIFSVKASQFFNFHENKAKYDKRNLKRGLTEIFKVKNSYNYRKIGFNFF